MRTRRLLLAPLLLVAVGILPGPADAAFCAKRSGAIVFRVDACRKRETQLAPAQIGVPAGPEGAKGDTGVAAPRLGLTLVDAAGNRVGAFVTSDGVERVFVRSPLAQEVLLVPVRRTRYAETKVNLYHVDPNCSAEAFVGGLPGRLYTDAVQWKGNVYYAGEPTDAAAREYASFERPDDPCPAGTTPTTPGFCCHNEPTTLSAGPVLVFEAAGLPSAPFVVIP